MNNQSPLLPQGSLAEQKNKGRSRVKFAVFLVLGLHIVGLMALLMIGCNRETPDKGSGLNTISNANTLAAEPLPSTPVTTTEAPSNPPSPSVAENPNLPTPGPSTTTTTAVSPTVVSPLGATPSSPVVDITATPGGAPTGGATEYKIQKSDTLAKIAKKSKIKLSELLAANPGIEPTKLKPGQTIRLPAAAAVTTSPSTPSLGAGPVAPGGAATEGHVYTVKSGDSLTRIAGQFGLKVKALRSANSLKTDKIRVGQKLKIPAKPAATPTTGAATPAAGAAPTTSPLPSPIGR